MFKSWATGRPEIKAVTGHPHARKMSRTPETTLIINK
jgi:hypothetical protein